MMYYMLINGTFAIAFLFERRGGDTALERGVPCPPFFLIRLTQVVHPALYCLSLPFVKK